MSVSDYVRTISTKSPLDSALGICCPAEFRKTGRRSDGWPVGGF